MQHLQGGQGWRGDGRRVPGNEHGGANGRYGRYGQAPDAPIPQGDERQIGRDAAAGITGIGGGDGGQQNASAVQSQPNGEDAFHSQAASMASRYRQPQMGGQAAQQQHSEPDVALRNRITGGAPQMGGQAAQQQPPQGWDMQQDQPMQQNSVQGLEQTPQSNAQAADSQPNSEDAFRGQAASMASRYGGGQQQQPAASPTPQQQQGITTLSGMQGTGAGQQNAAAVQQPQSGTQPAPAATPTAPTAAAAPAQAAPQRQGHTLATPWGQMNVGGGDSDAGGTPKMADGDIVTKPTRAIIGEDGPEMVVPLDNPNADVTPGVLSRYGHAAMAGLSQLGQSGLQNLENSRGGQMISAAHSRYAQGRMNDAMNENAAMMRQQGQQANLNNLPKPGGDIPNDGHGQGPLTPEAIPEAAPMKMPGPDNSPATGTPLFDLGKWVKGKLTSGAKADKGGGADSGTDAGADPGADAAGDAGADAGADAAGDAGADMAAAAFAKGGIATRPTNAIIGEHGPEAVVPVHPPGLFTPHRYRPVTGPSMVHSPLHAVGPAPLEKHKSNWKKWDLTH